MNHFLSCDLVNCLSPVTFVVGWALMSFKHVSTWLAIGKAREITGPHIFTYKEGLPNIVCYSRSKDRVIWTHVIWTGQNCTAKLVSTPISLWTSGRETELGCLKCSWTKHQAKRKISRCSQKGQSIVPVIVGYASHRTGVYSCPDLQRPALTTVKQSACSGQS